MGVIIAATIVTHLTEIFKNLEKFIMWSDSTIVLHWFRGQPVKWKQFVSNRVGEIREITNPSAWRHCISKENLSDLLTRDLSCKDLINLERCWHRPEWLTFSGNNWSNTEQFWVKTEQNKFFSNEILRLQNIKPIKKNSKLLCLNPFLDNKNIL